MGHRGRVYQYDTDNGKKWAWAIDYADPADGRRRTKTKKGHRTRRDAETALDAYRAAQGLEAPGDRRTLTVAAWYDQWLTDLYPHEDKEKSPGTLRNAALAGNWIRRVLGAVRLGDLTASDVDRLNKAMRDAGKASGTISNVDNFLAQAIDAAVARGHCDTNPVRAIKGPSRKVERDKRKRRLTGDELAALLAHLDQLDDDGRQTIVPAACERALFALLAFTGMRKGEALALTWRSVDLEARTVDVTHSRGRYGLGDPKTDAGRRRVPLPQPAADRLADWQAWLMEYRTIDQGVGWDDDAFVFVDLYLQPVREAWPTDRLPRTAADAGIDWKPTPHNLRHTWTTILAEAGVHPSVATAIVGHVDEKFTADVYTHPNAGFLAAEADRVARQIVG